MTDSPNAVARPAKGPKMPWKPTWSQPSDRYRAGTTPTNAIWSRRYSPPPTITEPITAKGMERCDSLVSPPSSTACSNPIRAKITPPLLVARSTPWSPSAKKPPTTKLWGSERVEMKATATSSGMRIFQHTTTALVSLNRRSPKTLSTVNPRRMTAAASLPTMVSTTDRPSRVAIRTGSR
jgi:hypothetical protein